MEKLTDRDTIEKEIYRLLSTKGTIDKNDIDSIGINVKRDDKKARVCVIFKDGTELYGKDLKSSSREAFDYIFDITNEFFGIGE